MVPLTLAFGASVAWGASDFLGGLASRRLPVAVSIAGGELIALEAGGMLLAIVGSVVTATEPGSAVPSAGPDSGWRRRATLWREPDSLLGAIAMLVLIANDELDDFATLIFHPFLLDSAEHFDVLRWAVEFVRDRCAPCREVAQALTAAG